MGTLLLERLSKQFGSAVAVDDVTLLVAEGEFVSLLGPSGCGKTTTLRMVAGFVVPSSGRIVLDGEEITGTPPQRRQAGMVFQNYVLFPHLTVFENVAFGLVEARRPATEIKRRVAELLALVQMQGMEERYPTQLSGGQEQRVALARALAPSPRLVLMDEPLGALDLKLRQYMQVELMRILTELKVTTVYVTHDQSEALSMSDRIAVMRDGRVEQIGTPREIYDRPGSPYVANFVGRVNFLRGVYDTMARGVVIGGGKLLKAQIRTPNVQREVILAVRPEHISVASESSEGNNILRGVVTRVDFHGNLVQLYVATESEHELVVEQPAMLTGAHVGQRVALSLPEDQLVVWPDRGEDFAMVGRS